MTDNRKFPKYDLREIKTMCMTKEDFKLPWYDIRNFFKTLSRDFLLFLSKYLQYY